MIFNYYLHTENDDEKQQLLSDTKQFGDRQAIINLLNKNNISLDDYTNPVEISLSLRRIGFKTLYKRKGILGSIGIAQNGYGVITEG